MAKSAHQDGRDSRTKRRRYALGESSREHILTVAETILRRDGYHAFTTRRVAQESGISVGNLTYYFPTKTTLVEAVMDAVYRRYKQRLDKILTDSDFDRPDSLMELVPWLLRDAIVDETRDLFLELWVMAKHHDFGSKILTRLYDDVARTIARILEVKHPNHSEQELIAISYLLLTLSEGSTALFGRKGKRAVTHEEVVELAVEAIEGLLKNA